MKMCWGEKKAKKKIKNKKPHNSVTRLLASLDSLPCWREFNEHTFLTDASLFVESDEPQGFGNHLIFIERQPVRKRHCRLANEHRLNIASGHFAYCALLGVSGTNARKHNTSLLNFSLKWKTTEVTKAPDKDISSLSLSDWKHQTGLYLTQKRAEQPINYIQLLVAMSNSRWSSQLRQDNFLPQACFTKSWSM